jgi:hypothetical protein
MKEGNTKLSELEFSYKIVDKKRKPGIKAKLCFDAWFAFLVHNLV